MNGLWPNKAWCLSLVSILCFLATPGSACPSCNIFNHLGTGVKFADFVGKATVVSLSADRRTVKLAIQEVLKGAVPKNSAVDYYNELRLDLSVGDLLLVVGSGGSTVVYNTVFPLSFLPEFRLLMDENAPQDAGEAVKYLTAVSAMLHWQGAPYYKAHPHEVQQRLKDWLQSIHIHPATPFYEAQQYLFGISAIMRGPPQGAEELAVQIMDEFWQLSETAAAEDAQWMLTKLTTVFSMTSAMNLQNLKFETERMLGSASEVQLLRLAQCLIISGLMSPAEIAASVPSGPGLDHVSQATLLAAWRHESVWSRDIARKLAETARELSGGHEDPMFTALVRKLENDSPLDATERPSLAETPVDPGWTVDSVLFDTQSWDKLEPYDPDFGGSTVAISAILLLTLIGLAALYTWRSRQRCRVRMGPAQ